VSETLRQTGETAGVLIVFYRFVGNLRPRGCDKSALNRESTIHTRRGRMVAVFVATIFSLVVFELVVRVTGVDWRCLKKNLFYNDGYHKTTMVDPDPEVMFRMRPNSRESIKIGRYGPVTITAWVVRTFLALK
jgi:hypothetical protein